MTTHTVEMVNSANTTPELDRLGDEIAELSAHLEAATARLLNLIREFDARGGWSNGFRSCAREKVRVARALGTLPRLAQALARGELSYAKVRALTRVATPETEERLLGVGRACTAEHVERIVRGWRRVDRYAESRESAVRHRSRALHVYRDDDGMIVVRGRLEPEVGELLVQALTAARESLYQRSYRTSVAGPEDVPAETPAMEQQQADALALLAETALHHGIFRPDGDLLPEVPAPSKLPTEPVKVLRAQNHAAALDVHSPKPCWFGERLDVGYAIDVLHPRARLQDTSEDS
jgi:hypothetical protein